MATVTPLWPLSAVVRPGFTGGGTPSLRGWLFLVPMRQRASSSQLTAAVRRRGVQGAHPRSPIPVIKAECTFPLSPLPLFVRHQLPSRGCHRYTINNKSQAHLLFHDCSHQSTPDHHLHSRRIRRSIGSIKSSKFWRSVIVLRARLEAVVGP